MPIVISDKDEKPIFNEQSNLQYRIICDGETFQIMRYSPRVSGQNLHYQGKMLLLSHKNKPPRRSVWLPVSGCVANMWKWSLVDVS